MNIWLISDTHFNHKNIIKYENRPFKDVAEMNDEMINRWNSVVKPEDIVYHLGDVALGPSSEFGPIVNRLNGHKVLIRGNHDGKSKDWYLKNGFDEVYSNLLLYVSGKRILLTHEPEKLRSLHGYDLHFYGHVHDKAHHGEYEGTYPTIAHNGACLCVERWNYYPVQMNTVIELCEKAENYCPSI